MRPSAQMQAPLTPTPRAAPRDDQRVRDDDVRSSCFAALDVLCAKHGPDVPYAGGLDQGFAFRGRRVPFLNYQKGIYRAATQRGPAALSVNTSFRSPYDDEETADGFFYAYRAGSDDQPDNRAVRAAHPLQVPVVYFVGTRRAGRPEWPVFPLALSTYAERSSVAEEARRRRSASGVRLKSDTRECVFSPRRGTVRRPRRARRVAT